MYSTDIAELVGVEVVGGPEPGVWRSLDRYADKHYKNGHVEEGAPRPTVRNIALIFATDSRWQGRIRHNLLSERVELDGEPVQDHDEIAAAIWLTDQYRMRTATPKVHEAAIHAGRLAAYHPIRDYLAALTWDGVDRVNEWLTTYLGVESSELIDEIGKRFLIACIARVMDPGCKHDHVLLLQGKQGARKSTALRLLFGSRWFSDTTPDLRNPRAGIETLQGLWCLEWAELDQMNRRDASTVKSFITTQIDRARPAYGRNILNRPRTCVITGSTNELEPLRDFTGERRFWPAVVTAIDLEGIRRDRDQLWAEALAWYRADRRWWLSDEMEQELISYGERFRQTDTWEEALADFIDAPIRSGGFSVSDVMTELDIDTQGQNRAVIMRVVGVLQKMGCTKTHTSRGNIWYPPGYKAGPQKYA